MKFLASPLILNRASLYQRKVMKNLHHLIDLIFPSEQNWDHNLKLLLHSYEYHNGEIMWKNILEPDGQ